MVRLRQKQHGTGLVEYGLVLGAVAVLVIVGLSSLSRAQAGYFATLEPSVAAPPTASIAGPRHSTAFEQPLGTPGPQCPASAIGGSLITCTAYVRDTSAIDQGSAPDRTAPSPPTGNVTWSMNGTPVASCAGLTPFAADTSTCPLRTPVVAPGVVAAVYDPHGSSFLASDGQTSIIVLPTPTPTPPPTPTPLPIATPIPCGEPEEGCQPPVVEQPGAEVGYVPPSPPD